MWKLDLHLSVLDFTPHCRRVDSFVHAYFES